MFSLCLQVLHWWIHLSHNQLLPDSIESNLTCCWFQMSMLNVGHFIKFFCLFTFNLLYSQLLAESVLAIGNPKIVTVWNFGYWACFETAYSIHCYYFHPPSLCIYVRSFYSQCGIFKKKDCFSCMMSLFSHSPNGLLAKTDVSATFLLLVMMPVNGGLSSGWNLN